MNEIAKHVERDLDSNEKENNYVTDDIAAALHDAVDALGRCGIHVPVSDEKIDRLAWFVGGDLEKIQLLQRLIKCRVYYSCHRLSSAAEIDFSTKDEYNFDELRSFEGSKDTFIVFSGDIGTYANDFGLVSQADGVISPYSISISFSQTLPL